MSLGNMFLIAFSLSLFLNLAVIFITKKFQLFIDENTSNKPQRFHTLPIPRAGGIGIFIPFFFCLLFLSFKSQDPLLQGLLWGGSIVFLSGIIEDFNASLSPKLRLFLQCLGGGVFVFLSGEYLNDLGFGITLPAYLGIPFSLFAIVGIINAINIIDGFNGLASGIALMALICMAFLLPISLSLSIICILIGSILGFWLFNFPWGKIFLGDGGAYFLGFVLASMLINLTQDSLGGGTRETSPWFGIALLIYPFWEVIFSIYRKKFLRGISPMEPDKLHLHMLIYKRMTKNNAKTTFFIFLCTFPFMIFSAFFAHQTWILCLLSASFIGGYLYLYRKIVRFQLWQLRQIFKNPFFKFLRRIK